MRERKRMPCHDWCGPKEENNCTVCCKDPERRKELLKKYSAEGHKRQTTLMTQLFCGAMELLEEHNLLDKTTIGARNAYFDHEATEMAKLEKEINDKLHNNQPLSKRQERILAKKTNIVKE